MSEGAGPLPVGGAWSARVVDEVASFESERRQAWYELLALFLAAGDSVPSKKWEGELQRRLEAVGRPAFLQRALEWLALGPAPSAASSPLASDRDADYLKGLVWALRGFDDPVVPRALADLAEQCLTKVPGYGAVSLRVGNACIRALADSSGMEPLAQLGRLRTRVKYAASSRLIQKVLTDTAVRVGLPFEDLEEIAVPTFGLDDTGALRRTVGGIVAELRIAGTDDVELSWLRPDGSRMRGTPAVIRQVHAPELRQLKKTVKDIERILQAQRARLERLLESERPISFDAWRARYVEHPLLGQMSRRLIWQFSGERGAELGVFRDSRIMGVNDTPLDRLSSSTVRLWHPLGCVPDLIVAWRRWLERHTVVQPFKQAHRESYVLTDAERITELYSNRFAAHILRQHQFAALCRERGWQYRLQGDWDAIDTAVRALPRWNLEIELVVERPVEEMVSATSGVFPYVCTDRVRFCRGGEPVRLEDVPAMAFSEAMRDVDLFVGVCSVGNDPTWPERDREAYGDYWRGYSSGDLSETARTRRLVLEALIPQLDIAGRLSLEERSLVVRGDLATYKVHLGSGNVLMEPDTQFLCISPGEEPDSVPMPHVWLPFEGDTVLHSVLSKAFMLAADTAITDPLIVPQIRRPPAV